MDKLLKLLGIDNLNEETQAEAKTKLQDIVDVKAKELSKKIVAEEKEVLVEKYEETFEKYKEEMTSKFSNFVDSVLDEELTIPENVLNYAKKGELYDDLIEQFKVRMAVDEGLLDEEVKGLLKEAKSEIVKNREEIDTMTEKILDLQSDAQEMAAQLYLHEKCKGLTKDQQEHVMSILEGVTDKAEIDRKFDVIVENYNLKEEDEEDDDDDDDDDDDKDEKDMKESTGNIDPPTTDDKDMITEDDESPFAMAKKEWKKILNTGKIT